MRVDLRSDTVTQPTPAMRRAMAEAVLGDDVYGEDPTVNRLQAMLAEMTGFETGLLMPSGSMSNQVALATHTGRGQEVIAPQGAHIYEYEVGALAAVSGLVPRLIAAPHGVPEADAIAVAIHHGIHQAPTDLIALENTHNRAGGTVVPLKRCREIADLAHQKGLPIHLDGARAFNAAAALGIEIAELCAPFDSVSICLSKGLAAPVGSVLLGSEEFISKAHRYRKMLGGGMRQAGVIAAAGIIALETMVRRLPEDHLRAHSMAEQLLRLPGLELDLGSVQSNMIYLEVDDAPGLMAEMAAAGVLANALGARTIRLVTHYQVTDEGVERAVAVISRLLERRATTAA